ncbi:hypothetical protein ILP92_17015 [Maribius pontilimi]|uniref:Contractile injection system tube protein N-terminal domain-containing protein n=1 Tax=Palleronia pontilimi TaxID=1964209 RepID=A0A934IC59_9RHOB|nr:hypothetical protein [Palleronia pontilimi]MBJ3764439.1 hypothetical protein [Palleronia pontilimi]
MTLRRATLQNISQDGQDPVTVMYNPKELIVTSNMLYPDISVPGLSVPLTQFVRGEPRTLEAELFLDRSNTGESLNDDLDALRAFVRINGELHAPPVCRFAWGDADLNLAEGDEKFFDGVVTEFKEKFQMFDEAGKVLRARVTVKLKEYVPADLQYTRINPQSPDRTKVRTVRAGDRYDLIAAEEYGDPALWRVLAAHNGDGRPRLLAPGTTIEIPSL